MTRQVQSFQIAIKRILIPLEALAELRSRLKRMQLTSFEYKRIEKPSALTCARALCYSVVANPLSLSLSLRLGMLVTLNRRVKPFYPWW